MYIGKVSTLTGATRKAIRHYEDIGLIPIPGRKGKYRVYSEKDVELILLIRHAQAFGFTLNEMKQLVAHKARYHMFPLKMAYDLIEQKQDALRREIKRLTEQDEGLKMLREQLSRLFGQSVSGDECKQSVVKDT